MSLLNVANKIPKQSKPPVQKELFGLAGKTVSKKGKQARIGNIFQKEVNETCDIYKQDHLAYIQQFYPPTIWIPAQAGKPGYLMHVKRSGFDFIGTYQMPFAERHSFVANNLGIKGYLGEDIKTMKIWTPVFIECKSTEGGRIDVGYEKSGIKLHQIEELEWLEKQGLETWIFWQIRRADMVVYKFRIQQLRDMIGGKKSLNMSDCEEHKIPKLFKIKHLDKLVYDFLDLLGGW